MKKKRYALVGTGSRARMFIEALTLTYHDVAELVAFCDVSRVRMDWYNHYLQTTVHHSPLPTYLAHDFERMIAETHPDTVIVTTIDSTHHIYIVQAMQLGCDVITEKPMTTTLENMQEIFRAIDQTQRSLRVSFNYRYTPAYTQYRELILQGVIGKPLAVDFSWILDTTHGADYFRRWHREKEYSGGLLVHKATHHFDLVNWWIDAYPQEVMALGDLQFYGKKNAEARGEFYPYERYTGVAEAKDDPFALTLDRNESFRQLYLAAEQETGYVRDRNVFGEPVTIEDTMCVAVRYRNRVLLSYCLIAYAPWEGLHVAITGTKGRIEMDIVEKSIHLESDEEACSHANASTGSFRQARIRVYPMFDRPYDVAVPFGDGGHGGADPILLEQLFSPTPPVDPFQRAASHIDGAASILVGIAANESMRTGKLITLDDLFVLPEKNLVHAEGMREDGHRRT